jgi:hypothetical protein
MRVWRVAAALMFASIAFEATAQAPPPKAGWYPFLGQRVKLSPASERTSATDYKPAEAGYVKLVVEPVNVQNAAYCQTQKKSGWKKHVDKLWGNVTNKKIVWGAGAVLTYPGSQSTTPAIEALPLKVTRFSSDKDCEAESKNTVVGTPLLRIITGGDPPKARIISWRTDTVDAEKVKEIFKGGEKLTSLAGVPAGIASVAFGNYVQTVFLQQINAETKVGHEETFEWDSADPTTGGAKVVNVYLGVEPKDMASWSPAKGGDPRFAVRLITVGSAFQPQDNTYPDLSTKTADNLLDDVRWSGKSVREYLLEVVRAQYEGMSAKAQSHAEFDAQCDGLRDYLKSKSGLSIVDAALILYALGLENVALSPSGKPFADTPLAKSVCLRAEEANLAKVKVKLPPANLPIVKPTIVAADDTAMVQAFEALLSVAIHPAAPVPPFSRQAAFGDDLTLLDSDRVLIGDDVAQQTIKGNEAIAELVRAKVQTLGCWLPLATDTSAALWPVGFTPPGSGEASEANTLAAAIAKLETGEVLLLAAEFHGREANKPATIAKLSVAKSFGAAMRDRFKARYPNAGCAAASLAPDVFQ